MSARDWLSQPLRNTVGGATAKALGAMDLVTVGDLLEHHPRRYTEHGQLSDIGSLKVDEQATVLAEVSSVTSRRMRQRRGTVTEVIISDGQHRLVLTFFNQHWRAQQLRKGTRGLFAGTVSVRNGQRQLTHPECLVFGPGATIGSDDPRDADPSSEVERDLMAIEYFTDYLIPIYPATATLPSWRIQKAIGVLLDTMPELPEVLPAEVVEREQLLSRTDAVRLIHRPRSMAEVKEA
ncbi:MAG TPA: OB-fold nucleic acid binding domain-containing protein, partial [Actinomycetes bacterium]|nr:OB-fold nucleic acid binding domain-containing protein [Actinomycetes bacterium]